MCHSEPAASAEDVAEGLPWPTSVSCLRRERTTTLSPLKIATESAGMDFMSQTLEPMIEWAPMDVSPPRIVACA